jgi:hypothetical protein
MQSVAELALKMHESIDLNHEREVKNSSASRPPAQTPAKPG